MKRFASRAGSLQRESFVCLRCSLRQNACYRYRALTNWARQRVRDDGQALGTIKNDTVLDILEERGLINQRTGDRSHLADNLSRRKPGVYVGVDPTAASLHVGHLVPFMALFWMYIFGYPSSAIIGGATSQIGDPSGRIASREILKRGTREDNTHIIEEQLKHLFNNAKELASGCNTGAPSSSEPKGFVSNNLAWTERLSFLKILSTLGTGFRLGPMLSRDTVKLKMEKGDGMSFAEFSYPLLQAWDWWHLYQSENIQIQIGGSDQFGNIVTGIDAIRHMMKISATEDIRRGTHEEAALYEPFGLTTPLLTTSSGAKFGKSAGNAVWLEKSMTSVFDLYGFFVSTPDDDVERLLKFFTFLDLDKIKFVIEEHKQSPGKRTAQHLLAHNFVALVHGAEEAKTAQQQHRASFGRSEESTEESLAAFKMREDKKFLPRSEVIGQLVDKVLYNAGIVTSRSKARNLLDSDGFKVYRKFSSSDPLNPGLAFCFENPRGKDRFIEISEDWLLDGNILVFKIGKNKIRTIELTE